jgi:hypothetical protein
MAILPLFMLLARSGAAPPAITSADTHVSFIANHQRDQRNADRQRLAIDEELYAKVLAGLTK